MSRKKRVLIAAGGTGGHIYPALALAKQLSQDPELEIAFVGGNLKLNRYFDQTLYPFYNTPCGSFTSKNPLKLLSALKNIGKGIWHGHRAIQQFKPDIAVGFGSYYTFPALIAALLKRVPVILHEANSIPGKVNRLLSPYAQMTGIHFPGTSKLMKGKTTLVGMPLRPGFRKGSVSTAEAKAYFNLQSGKPTLLVFGGSQGAQAINDAVMHAVTSDIQIIHLTGHTDMTKKTIEHYLQHHVEANVKEFETRMDLAWAAADFVICRSGAGTISEAIEYEVPALLIPFPRAADNHQEINADFMVDTVGGAEKLLERDLDDLPSKMKQMLSQLPIYREKIGLYKQNANEMDLSDLIKKKLWG